MSLSSPRARNKQFSYTVEVIPDDAGEGAEAEASLAALVQKLRQVEVGGKPVAWREGSVEMRRNNFGEAIVHGAFTTQKRSDSDALEEEVEDWPGVKSVSVTRSVVEFKISKTTNAKAQAAGIAPVGGLDLSASAAGPGGANGRMRERRPSLKSVGSLVRLAGPSGSMSGPGSAPPRARSRVRAPPTPAHDKRTEAQRKKKARAARKQERADALELLQKLLAVHTEHISILRRRLLDESGKMRELDRVEVTGLSVSNCNPVLIGTEMRVRGTVEMHFFEDDSSAESNGADDDGEDDDDDNDDDNDDSKGTAKKGRAGGKKGKRKGSSANLKQKGPTSRPLSDTHDAFVWFREPGRCVVSEVSTYTPTADDVGHCLRVEVTANRKEPLIQVRHVTVSCFEQCWPFPESRLEFFTP